MSRARLVSSQNTDLKSCRKDQEEEEEWCFQCIKGFQWYPEGRQVLALTDALQVLRFSGFEAN